MAFMSEFKYEGIHSLIAFDLGRPKQIKQKAFSLDKTMNSSSVRSDQKLAFRPYLPDKLIDSKENDQKKLSDVEDDSSLQEDDSSEVGDQMVEKQDSQKTVRMRKGPYKKYTTEQKKAAIEMINSGKDIKSVSKQYNIPRRNLLRWRKNGCQRKEGGGRPSDFIMEEKLFQMIIKKEVTSEKRIRQLALEMTNFKKFKASKGWYVKFWRRFNEYRGKTAFTLSPENAKFLTPT